jgi:hypothetical protein
MGEYEIEKIFPNLRISGYSITSPATTEYNCIAWSVGDTEVWWWPDSQHLYYWPSELPRIETLDAFIKVFEILGYSVCNDAVHEKGFEKIAIYVDSKGKPAHVARQLSSGSWTSKLGQLEDVEHSKLNDIAGLQYGSVGVILKRQKL